VVVFGHLLLLSVFRSKFTEKQRTFSSIEISPRYGTPHGRGEILLFFYFWTPCSPSHAVNPLQYEGHIISCDTEVY
jgi:hypothetical protein